MEIYDQQDATRVDDDAKGRQATIGLGGRHSMDRKHSVLLLLMGGRSFQKIALGNVQPSWIAYVGVQSPRTWRDKRQIRRCFSVVSAFAFIFRVFSPEIACQAPKPPNSFINRDIRVAC